MDINPIILSIPIYFALIGAELIWQASKKVRIYRTNDAISNISCGISSQVAGAIWGVLSIAMYQLVYEYMRISTLPNSWWSQVILFVLVDFLYYWYHRASHEINFLWNVTHVVHHQSEDYNLSVALRQSSFGGLFSILFYLPLAVLGFDVYAFIFIKGINLIYQFWIHTEAIDKLPRWFEFVFNTPSHHRVHHGRNPEYIDKNHAGTLMIWDRMFGTFQKEEEKPVYGITTPVNTWNPIWANVQPIVRMGKQVLHTVGFLNKLKVLFYKPGWRTKEQGGYLAAPEINSMNQEKFNIRPIKRLVKYLFVHFILVLGLTAYFLFNHKTLAFYPKIAFAGFIVWSIIQLGLLMENRKKWVPFEFIRIVVGSVFIYGILLSTSGILFAATVLIISIIWFRSVCQNFTIEVYSISSKQ